MNYYERYNNLITEAQANPSKYPGETHHIIPRSIHKRTPSTTPVNAPENLVFLSHRQHLEAHWLLFKAYENTVHAGNMATAFVLMIEVGKTPAQPTAAQYHAYEVAKIAASKAQGERNSGEGNPMFGKTHSTETKAKMSASKSGEKSHMFGKTVSPEIKAKISASLSGEKHPMFGKTISPEIKVKISASLSGEKHPMFGKPRAEGAGRPSKPVINTETGEVWESLSECARQLGAPFGTIHSRIKNKSHGGIWQFVENHNKMEVI